MNKEAVRLHVPAKAEYIVITRLVVGAIFGREGYDVDDIENAKTALSEACLLLMSQSEKDVAAQLDLEFWTEHGGVYCKVSREGVPANNRDTAENEFGRFMLEALADQVAFKEEGGISTYCLYKANHK